MPMRRLRLRGRHDRIPTFLGAALALLTAACLLLGTSIARQIEKHDVEPTEPDIFGLAQIEVEFMKFDRALRDAATGQGDLEDLRLWFDIFYSRVIPPETSGTFSHYIDDPDFIEAYDEVRGFVQAALPVLEADDARVAASLPELVAMSAAVEPWVRKSALIGLTYASDRNAALWDRVSTSLRATGRFLAAGVAGLVLLSAALLVVFRTTVNRAREIETQSSQMRTIVGTSLDAIFVLDSRGRIKTMNKVAQDLFGLDPAEVAGRDMLPLLFDEAERGRLRFLGEGRRPGPDERRLEATARASDDRPVPIEISVDATKTPEGWAQVAFLRDISQRRETEAALREARDRALAGERSKADFLAVMSHEMRTPLNGILGALELLRDTSLDGRQQQLVNTIERSGDLMLGLVEDVLDIAKFDADRVEPDLRAGDLPTLVESVVGTLGALADSAGLTLSWTRADEVPDRIVTDPKMLRHVLLNLVGNAIKFTREGRVDIALHLEDGETLEIRVSDTGIGIAPEDRERIFGAFETADPTYARRHRGTGLGLGIATRIMNSLGGTIGVESEQGVGSTFWVRLPVNVAVPEPVVRTAAPSRPLRVLLIEDNDINRLVARDFLRAEGHEVVEARDGLEGVACAEKEAFDVILMDISMPVLDGPTAARRIRSGGGPSSGAPIIGVTAHVLPEELEAFRAAGMNSCVTKPLDRAALAETVTRAARAPEPLCRPEMIESILATLGPDRTAELVQSLSRQMERDLPALSDPAQSVEQRRRLAHDLAGAAASFGMMRLHESLCVIERSIKTDGEVPTRTLPQLRGLWDGSRRALGHHLPASRAGQFSRAGAG
ncbi:PAS domain S-box-containing protein [Palleronia marisminoris]|uniref:histidine kinase n=1 Tax=Palleronia marisminoris TaxID=315423 RepID=A0A1Y5RY54_9RHOB|nr:ATP-binding protein [Palleronia marisminoris]SFG42211.1 PAS domain S-box-containing protein [Palleronia marisminoris]SLN27686.1 Sensory/regulatory protein RpfC [Palleronia marisminoris]